VQRTIVVNKAAQTINFTAPTSPVTFGVAPVTLSATSTSGSLLRSRLTGAQPALEHRRECADDYGAGTIVIDANQAGNGIHCRDPVATDDHRQQAAQTINFTAPISPVTFGVAPVRFRLRRLRAHCYVHIDGSSTGTGTIVGNTLTITGQQLVIDANQVGSPTI